MSTPLPALDALEKMDWQAAWIWHPATEQPRFEVCYFRRAFDLRDPRGATLVLHVSADSRYRLYLNGDLVGRGPARGDVEHYIFETYDLSARLRRGRNVLAVQVMAYGLDGPLPEVHEVRGGLAVQGGVQTRDEFLKLDTNAADWRVLADTAYAARTCTPPGHFDVNPFEIVDGAAYPWGWTAVAYDDATWPVARAIGQALRRDQWAFTSLRWRLVPRPVAAMTEEPFYPEAVRDAPHSDDLRRLLAPRGGPPLVIPAHTTAEWTIYLGRMLTGYPRLVTGGGAGARDGAGGAGQV